MCIPHHRFVSMCFNSITNSRCHMLLRTPRNRRSRLGGAERGARGASRVSGMGMPEQGYMPGIRPAHDTAPSNGTPRLDSAQARACDLHLKSGDARAETGKRETRAAAPRRALSVQNHRPFLTVHRCRFYSPGRKRAESRPP